VHREVPLLVALPPDAVTIESFKSNYWTGVNARLDDTEVTRWGSWLEGLLRSHEVNDQ
jgi:hypothetical protein